MRKLHNKFKKHYRLYLFFFRRFIIRIVTLKYLRSSSGNKILTLFNLDFLILFDDQPNISQNLNNGTSKVSFKISSY